MRKNEKNGKVGFMRPPEEHRFKPGFSGNPAGRPRKKQRAEEYVGSTEIDALVLAEMDRKIEVGVGSDKRTMSLAQAILRGKAAAALAGDQKVGSQLLEMAQAAKVREQLDVEESRRVYDQYVESWRALFDDCDARGRLRPEPVPHPDEMAFDLDAPALIKFHGPTSERQRARWDAMLDRREEALEEVTFLEGIIARDGDPSGVFSSEIAHLQQLADIIIGMLPSQEIRRRPGFDLEKWRAKSGAREQVAKLRAAASSTTEPPQRSGAT